MSSTAPAADAAVTFADLALSEPVLAALKDVGYESPSPIQAQTIPLLLAGQDVVGQAQTGTGKTAAFALPVLSKVDLQRRATQALVLVPTRELAIQVAEAFQRYATYLKGFHVLPIYGGQSYVPQLQSLKRGAHVVVGTPGRVMDHIKRGTLSLEHLNYLVLDEADEMLQMGFLEDVEWVLEQAPPERQIALFSATMPPAIRRISQTHLRSPAEVTIRSSSTTAAKIRQRYWIVDGVHKLDALTRILEAEPFDAMLVFMRTKQATTELTERLEARGFTVEALHGDIQQAQRERTIANLKSRKIDIVVATDVAARGLDVERVTHVVNFDVPYDPESYVHRIGRTGRAGRSGDAILFIAPRERNMLRVIERSTRQTIAPMQLPTIDDVNEQRVARFSQRITDTLAAGEGAAFRSLIERYEQEHNVPAIDIAAALASIAQGKKPLLLEAKDSRKRETSSARDDDHRAANTNAEEPRELNRRAKRRANFEHASGTFQRERKEGAADTPPRFEREQESTAAPRPPRFERNRDDESGKPPHRSRAEREQDDGEMETYRIEVGRAHGAQPGNIVGAIANETGIEGRHIGRVVIRDDHSFVDLPTGMPKEIFLQLQKVRVAGEKMQISRALKTQKERLSRDGDAPPRSFAKPHKMARSRPADSPHPMTKPSFKKKKVHRKGNGDKKAR